jgi:hypothetical protein
MLWAKETEVKIKRARKKLETHFLHVLPILSLPVVISVCRVHVVTTHILKMKSLLIILNIYLRSLSLFFHPHVCFLFLSTACIICKQELCRWVSPRRYTCYLLIWFKNDWSINIPCKGVISNENVKLLLAGEEQNKQHTMLLIKVLRKIPVCRSWLDRQTEITE